MATVLTITENFVQFGHAVFETDRHTDKLIAILGTHTGDEVVLPRNGWYHCEPTTGVISGGSGGPDPPYTSSLNPDFSDQNYDTGANVNLFYLFLIGERALLLTKDQKASGSCLNATRE